MTFGEQPAVFSFRCRRSPLDGREDLLVFVGHDRAFALELEAFADRILSESACARRPSASASAIPAGSNPAQAVGRDRLHRGHAHEVGGAESSARRRRAAGRQHVVGARDVVAARLRAVAADEDRACSRQPRRDRLGVADGVLGRESLHERDRLVERTRHDDAAVRRQRLSRRPVGRQLLLHFARDGQRQAHGSA